MNLCIKTKTKKKEQKRHRLIMYVQLQIHCCFLFCFLHSAFCFAYHYMCKTLKYNIQDILPDAFSTLTYEDLDINAFLIPTVP